LNWLLAIELAVGHSPSILCVQSVCAGSCCKADASGRRDSELRVMLCVRTDLGMKVAVQGLWFMVYVLCFMFYVLCFMFYALYFMFCVSCFMFYISIFMPHPSTFSVTHPRISSSINSCPQPGKVAAQCGHAVLGM
jgi:hypothetical protein